MMGKKTPWIPQPHLAKPNPYQEGQDLVYFLACYNGMKRGWLMYVLGLPTGCRDMVPPDMMRHYKKAGYRVSPDENRFNHSGVPWGDPWDEKKPYGEWP